MVADHEELHALAEKWKDYRGSCGGIIAPLAEGVLRLLDNLATAERDRDEANDLAAANRRERDKTADLAQRDREAWEKRREATYQKFIAANDQVLENALAFKARAEAAEAALQAAQTALREIANGTPVYESLGLPENHSSSRPVAGYQRRMESWEIARAALAGGGTRQPGEAQA